MTNKLINTGCDQVYNVLVFCDAKESEIHSRCISARADSAFMFLGFIACLGAIIASFLAGRHR